MITPSSESQYAHVCFFPTRDFFFLILLHLVRGWAFSFANCERERFTGLRGSWPVRGTVTNHGAWKRCPVSFPLE